MDVPSASTPTTRNTCKPAQSEANSLNGLHPPQHNNTLPNAHDMLQSTPPKQHSNSPNQPPSTNPATPLTCPPMTKLPSIPSHPTTIFRRRRKGPWNHTWPRKQQRKQRKR